MLPAKTDGEVERRTIVVVAALDLKHSSSTSFPLPPFRYVATASRCASRRLRDSEMADEVPVCHSVINSVDFFYVRRENLMPNVGAWPAPLVPSALSMPVASNRRNVKSVRQPGSGPRQAPGRREFRLRALRAACGCVRRSPPARRPVDRALPASSLLGSNRAVYLQILC